MTVSKQLFPPDCAPKKRIEQLMESLRVKRTVYVSCLLLVCLLMPLWALGASVDFDVEFNPADLTFSKPNGYDLIEVPGKGSSLQGEPGHPWLPCRDINVLLPRGQHVASLKVDVVEETPVKGSFNILPVQKPVPISFRGPVEFTAPDPAVYRMQTATNPEPVELLRDDTIRGRRIVTVRVYPIAYVPATGSATLRSRLKISLELGDSKELAATQVTLTDDFTRMIADEVINPDCLAETEEGVLLAPLSTSDEVKYILISDESMRDAFQPLIDWKNKKGVPARFVSTQWIYATYAGSDDQEMIKACIRDFALNNGTVWVALGGDDTLVPDRDCYSETNYGYYKDQTIPTDLYYADIDDMNWNDDGDERCGEASGDSIDMRPDVFVGRLPIRTAAQASAVVAKTLKYEREPPSSGFAEKMLLAGAMLWNAGDAEAKSEFMYSDWIEPYWDGVRYRFYDTNTDFPGGSSYQMNPANLNTQLNAGYNFLHMATHGNQTIFGMEGNSYETSYALALTNLDRLVNIATMACHTNAFDNSYSASDPCLSEAFFRNANGGAVTYIGSSRYGWGVDLVSAHGASFQYDRMFYEFLFEGEPAGYSQHVGAVFSRMKEYWIGSCTTDGAMRWLQFSINLIGDPELPLYTADPSSITPTFSPTASVGPSTFAVETGVPGAKVCLLKEGIKGYEVYTYGNADGTGHFEAAIEPTTVGTMYVTVTALNHVPSEGTVEVLLGSDGVVYLDRDWYTANESLSITLSDADLKGTGTCSVSLDTSSSADHEEVILTETGPSSGIFEGSAVTAAEATSAGNGQLEVVDGDIITVTYLDEDNGSGGTSIDKTDTAQVDIAPPVFAGIEAAIAGDGVVNLSWSAASDPRGPVTYRVYRAETLGAQDFATPLAEIQDVAFADKSAGNGVKYYYVVRAADSVGNEDGNVKEVPAIPMGPVVLQRFSLDTDPGWSVEGQWSYGPPSGDGGEYGWPDPTSGYSGANVYGYNLDGDYENGMSGTDYLTTPPIDCTSLQGVTLRFRRWLGVERSTYDHATVEVSNDGTTWHVVWENPDVHTMDESWTLQSCDISAYADDEPVVYIRWGIGPTDSSWRFCGWNIDDVEIVGDPGDSDKDGLPDMWEGAHFKTLDYAATDDIEPDGLCNFDELRLNCDPTNPNTDGDTFDDGNEYLWGLDPCRVTYFVDDADGDDSYDGLSPDPDGVHGPKKTLAAALDLPGNDYEVAVMPGTYSGEGNRDLQIVARSISLVGVDGPENTIIDCAGAARAAYVETGTEDAVSFKGFSFLNGSTTEDGGAIYCRSSQLTLENCVFSGNSGNTGGAICMRVECSVVLKNCLLTGNTSAVDGGGIFCGYSKLDVSNCTIAGNSSERGGALSVTWLSECTVSDSILWNNSATTGNTAALISTSNPSTLAVEYSTVEDGTSSVSVASGNTLQWGAGNVVEDPLFVAGPNGDYYLSQPESGQAVLSPCVDSGDASSSDAALDDFTTMTTGQGDSGTVDMGYHYGTAGELRFLSMRKAGDDLILSWSGSVSGSCVLQWSDDMSSWNDVDVGHAAWWIDPDGAVAGKRYYRIIETH